MWSILSLSSHSTFHSSGIRYGNCLWPATTHKQTNNITNSLLRTHKPILVCFFSVFLISFVYLDNIFGNEFVFVRKSEWTPCHGWLTVKIFEWERRYWSHRTRPFIASFYSELKSVKLYVFLFSLVFWTFLSFSISYETGPVLFWVLLGVSFRLAWPPLMWTHCQNYMQHGKTQAKEKEKKPTTTHK